jgi:hypothetical protein
MVRRSKSPQEPRARGGDKKPAAKAGSKPAAARGQKAGKSPRTKAGSRPGSIRPKAGAPKPRASAHTGSTAAKPRTRARTAAVAVTETPKRRRPRAQPQGGFAPALPTEQDEVASTRYSAAETTRLAVEDDSFAFPKTYGRTRVRLLMQSPGRLFVHWDLSPGVFEELRAQLGRRAASPARLAVRITTPGAVRPLLVMLPRGARSWYVDVPGQRQEYRAELGLMLPSGEFRALATSNVVRMPRTTPSPVPAGRRVAVSRAHPPDAGSIGDVPPDEATDGEPGSDAESTRLEGETSPAPGGSSALSGARGQGSPTGQPRGGGSSSDFRPHR